MAYCQRANVNAATALLRSGRRKDVASVRLSLAGVKCFEFVSVLWHCWLGEGKDFWPVKRLCHQSQRF